MANLNIPTKNNGDTLSASEFNQIVDAVNGKVDAVSGKGLSTNDYTMEDKSTLTGMNAKIISLENRVDVLSGSVISLDEHEAGVLRYGGKEYTVYELTAEIGGLPVSSGASTTVVLSSYPCGDNLYLSAQCISVAIGNVFLPSVYEVKKVYVDNYQNTAAEIVCKEAVTGTPKVLLTIRYVKGLLSFDILQIRIPLSDLTSGADGVSASVPVCKYDKAFALSFVGDDSLLGIYQRAFNYIFARWVDDNPTKHDTEPNTTGITPTRKLVYTDGAGNDIPFRLGTNWMDSKPGSNYHTDGNIHLPYMWWSEGKRFYDYFNAILNHGGGNSDDPLGSITKNQQEITTNMGMTPFVLGVPGGTTGYPEAAESLEYIYMMESSSFKGSTELYPKLSDIAGNVLKKRFGRICIDTYSLDQIKSILGQYARDYRWINLFCHNIKNGQSTVTGQLNADVCFSFLDYVYDTYGKGGDDSVWFGSDTEIFEYLFARLNSVITKEVDGSDLLITVKAAKLPNFYYKELSLVFSGVTTMVNAIYSDNVRNASATSQLLNLMYSEHAVPLAEKYTAIYEASTTTMNKNEAYFFVNRLRPDLAASFIARLRADESAPVLNSISINGGVTVTYSQAVTVALAVTGLISHYKISESATMSDVNWIESSMTTIPFNLSNGYGTKHVYVQVKNEFGESEIKTASIAYTEAPENTYTVTGRSNNGSYGIVSPATQEVAEGGTANLTAQANDGYEIESWDGATSSTGAGTVSGTAQVTNVQANRTVMCNFRSSGGTGSGSKIILFPTGTGMGVVTLPNGLKATYVRTPLATSIGDTPFVNTAGEAAGSKVTQAANLPDGVTDMSEISSSNPILSGDTGVYPDTYIKSLYGVYTSGTYPSARGIVRLKDMKPAVYKVKVLYSTGKTLTAVQIAGISYEANGVAAVLPESFNPTNNNSVFVEMDNVIVGSDGILDIYMGNTQAWARTGWNAIEIEEV